MLTFTLKVMCKASNKMSNNESNKDLAAILATQIGLANQSCTSD